MKDSLLSGKIRAALNFLDVDRFALAIHDQSFPSDPDEESGRGTPYGTGGVDFLEFASQLGFNTLQLGPQGITSRSDPSPYNGSVFSKDPLSLAPSTLCHEDTGTYFVRQEDLEQCMHSAGECSPDRVDYSSAWRFFDTLMDNAYRRLFKKRSSEPAVRTFRGFCAERLNRPVNWFERDAVYQVLSSIEGTDDWHRWGRTPTNSLDRHLFSPPAGQATAAVQRRSALLKAHPDYTDRFALGQFLWNIQHTSFRARMKNLGLSVYGDAQIGFSHRDRWSWQAAFLNGYLMGAPPSRSNPEGQPWGYPLLDPRQMSNEGIAYGLLRERFGEMMANYDGIRIDHPHGLVCPWVYRSDDPDPIHAVQTGSRLNCAPNLANHPELAQFALVSSEQLNGSPSCSRYDDDYVLHLDPSQIDRFGLVINMILELAHANGHSSSAVLCEVLSTLPFPLKAVMVRNGLGRFCVTQKALHDDPKDVYRSENTQPEDWIMVGTHDTPSLWNVVDTQDDQWRFNRAGLLALHLANGRENREELQRTLAADKKAFCKGMFAELFLAPARNISVFFTDLLGMRETYNQPGSVGSQNWTLRVPRNYRKLYAQRCADGQAFDVAGCLAMALRIKARDVHEGDILSLADRLEKGDAV